MAENECSSQSDPHDEGKVLHYKGSVKLTGSSKLSGHRRGEGIKLPSSLLCREWLSLFWAVNGLAWPRRLWGGSISVCRPHGHLAASLGFRLSSIATPGLGCGISRSWHGVGSGLSPSFTGCSQSPSTGVTLCPARNHLAPSVFCHAHQG